VLRLCPIVVTGGLDGHFHATMTALVEEALSFVAKEIDECGQHLIKQAQALTPEQRAALPPWGVNMEASMFRIKEPRKR
jgi:hypothetical protein